MNKKIIFLISLMLLVGVIITGYFLFFSKTMISSLERENKGRFPSKSFLIKTIDNPEGETKNCEDSDGYDLFSEGETFFNYPLEYSSESGSVRGSYIDICDFTNDTTRKGKLREGYCDKGLFKFDWIDCGKGYVCRAGKCVKGDSSLSTCVDTDGGKNEFVKGSLSSASGSGEDSCYTVNAMTPDCSGEGCSVYEYYCDGEMRAWEKIPCPKGCKDGTCIR